MSRAVQERAHLAVCDVSGMTRWLHPRTSAMRTYKDPPGIEALAQAQTPGQKLMVKYLFDRDWALLEELIQSETQRLLALFPHLRKRIAWDMLQWRIMLENERGDAAAEMRLLRERMRMRPQTPWGRSSDHLSVALLLRDQGDTEGAVRELNRGVRFALEHGDSTAISLMHELAKMGRLPLRVRYIRAVQMVSTRFLEEPVAVPRTSDELERIVAELHQRQHTQNHGR